MTESELKGKVTIISMEKRQITLKDTDGILHPFTWTEPLDVVMRKWKEGYYLAVKYDGSILKNASYWQEGKDAFPKQQGTGYKGQTRCQALGWAPGDTITVRVVGTTMRLVKVA